MAIINQRAIRHMNRIACTQDHQRVPHHKQDKTAMKPTTMALCILLSLGLGACGHYAPQSGTFAKPLLEPYKLDSGDQIRVIVFGQRDLSNTYRVDKSGYIQMPLIGSVAARGMTSHAIASAIAAKLRNGYLRKPDVSVEVAQFRPFFILGEVRNAGQFPYVNGMTVETAVAIASGFSERANKSSVLLSRTRNGKTQRFKVPVGYPVRPGDTIYVEERFF